MRLPAQNPFVTVRVNLAQIRENFRAIAAKVKVPVLAVVKANAYGLGAEEVAVALRDLADGFCVFALQEAVNAELWHRTGKPILALGPPSSMDPADFVRHAVNPAISTLEQAVLLKAARPAVCVDTGMQRFTCPAEQLQAVIKAADAKEAFTHGTRLEHATRLAELVNGRSMRRHAAASALLDEPQSWLDAVRPGIALYHNAVEVVTTLVEVHDSTGPAGYTGFVAPRHGVILVGYSHGLRKGICSINGATRKVLEVGMQSSFVEVGDDDRVGDTVTLLGSGAQLEDIAKLWGASPQEVLMSLTRAGRHEYE